MKPYKGYGVVHSAKINGNSDGDSDYMEFPRVNNQFSRLPPTYTRNGKFSSQPYQTPFNGLSSEDGFDEIESLRTEVKRLSDKVKEQSNFVSSLQLKINSFGGEEKDNLDVLTELYQHKISLACLERANFSTEASLNSCKREIIQLTNITSQQKEELDALRKTVQDICRNLPQSSVPASINDEELSATIDRHLDKEDQVSKTALESVPFSYSDSYRSASCNELRPNRARLMGVASFRELHDHRPVISHDFGRPLQSKNASSSFQIGPNDRPKSRSLLVRSQFPPTDSYRHSLKGNSHQHPDQGPAKTGGWAFFLKSPMMAIKRSTSRSFPKKASIPTDFDLEEDFQSCASISGPRVPSLEMDYNSTCSLLLPTSTDFEDWSADSVCTFLGQLGLGYCEPTARCWVRSGSDLINANARKLEQSLGISKPLHLKKLIIHIGLRTRQRLAAYRETSYLPVIYPHPDFLVSTWLEDLGLMMYRETFDCELIDAYVLNELTLVDLQLMDISNELHMLSLRRGLQVLRHINFDLTRLCRRPVFQVFDSRSRLTTVAASFPANRSDSCRSPPGSQVDFNEDPPIPALMTTSEISMKSSRSLPSTQKSLSPSASGTPNIGRESWVESNEMTSLPSPEDNRFMLSSETIRQDDYSAASDLSLWTFHRLEAWLRGIELPEYVSNLRGSGLHGALFVYEDRFTADTLAGVLDIAASKTLLRRHLTDNFAALIGEKLFSRKRSLSSRPDAIPLTEFGKFKTLSRKTVFASPKKRGVCYLDSEPLCPAEAGFDFIASS